MSSTTRGVYSMGRTSSGDFATNVIDYITIGSTGNGSDFGDLSAVTHSAAGCSSGHGGIAA